MPEISRFFGIVIRMYFDDHDPPHFHAVYERDEAQIGIDPLTVLNGSLPSRALSLTIEWAADHSDELMENWQLLQFDRAPNRIQPLR